MSGNKTTTLTMIMDVDMHRRFKRLCAERGTSMTDVVRSAVSAWMETGGKPAARKVDFDTIVADHVKSMGDAPAEEPQSYTGEKPIPQRTGSKPKRRRKAKPDTAEPKRTPRRKRRRQPVDVGQAKPDGTLESIKGVDYLWLDGRRYKSGTAEYKRARDMWAGGGGGEWE